MTRPVGRPSPPAGVVLAAGEGRRFGGPKAPAVIGSERLVDRAVRVLREGGCDPVLVVLGAWTGEVPGARVVVNDAWADGMGSSLRAGLAALADEPCDAAVVTLVDLPDVTPPAIARLVASGADLAAAAYDGRRGHPVLLGRRHWPAAEEAADGDTGARAYVAGHPGLVLVEVGDVAAGTDLDDAPAHPVVRPGYPLLHVETLAEWRSWLLANADTSRGVWVVSWRRPTGRPFVAYDQLRDEALTIGWIDSTVKKIDDERAMIQMTPRRPGSVWSRINKERIADLTARGRMQPRGLAVVEAAVADGSWTSLDAVEALEEPADLAAALDAVPAARATWDGFPPGARKQGLYLVSSAKRPDTRARRIERLVSDAAAGRRPG